MCLTKEADTVIRPPIQTGNVSLGLWSKLEMFPLENASQQNHRAHGKTKPEFLTHTPSLALPRAAFYGEVPSKNKHLL